MAIDKRFVTTFLFHLLVFAMYMFTLIYETMNIPTAPHRQSYGGRFKFLTFWNQLVQTTYFGYSVINDIFGSNTALSENHNIRNKSALQRARDFFAASIVFPGSMFVATTFWTLYAIDRELVYPSTLDKIYPPWLNHMWHTNIVLFLLVERLFIYHEYPRRLSSISALIGFAVIYQLWMFWVAYYAKLWIYPVLEVLGWRERLVFLVACWLLMIVCYFVGEFLTNVLWRTQLAQVVATKAE